MKFDSATVIPDSAQDAPYFIEQLLASPSVAAYKDHLSANWRHAMFPLSYFVVFLLCTAYIMYRVRTFWWVWGVRDKDRNYDIDLDRVGGKFLAVSLRTVRYLCASVFAAVLLQLALSPNANPGVVVWSACLTWWCMRVYQHRWANTAAAIATQMIGCCGVALLPLAINSDQHPVVHANATYPWTFVIIVGVMGWLIASEYISGKQAHEAFVAAAMAQYASGGEEPLPEQPLQQQPTTNGHVARYDLDSPRTPRPGAYTKKTA